MYTKTWSIQHNHLNRTRNPIDLKSVIVGHKSQAPTTETSELVGGSSHKNLIPTNLIDLYIRITSLSANKRSPLVIYCQISTYSTICWPNPSFPTLIEDQLTLIDSSYGSARSPNFGDLKWSDWFWVGLNPDLDQLIDSPRDIIKIWQCL